MIKILLCGCYVECNMVLQFLDRQSVELVAIVDTHGNGAVAELHEVHLLNNRDKWKYQNRKL